MANIQTVIQLNEDFEIKIEYFHAGPNIILLHKDPKVDLLFHEIDILLTTIEIDIEVDN